MRPIRLFALSIILMILTFSVFCGKRPSSSRKNIVLISIDTLRGDYFTPEFMPKTYAWAEENCAVFPNAYSHSIWTTPSHATMLSGLLQGQHKIDFMDNKIPPEIGMVQEELRDGGYRTLASTSGGYISRRMGFDRGFDEFIGSSYNIASDKKEPTVRDILEKWWRPVEKSEELIASIADARPFFLFIHTYFVHEYFLFKFDMTSPLEADRRELRRTFSKSESIQSRRKCYGLAVKEMDTRLHRFIQNLLSSRHAADLAIIITSDHGEGLGDMHGDYTSLNHWSSPPYSELIHVPLIVYGLPKGVYEDLVGVKDIPGMIRAFAGLENGMLFPKNDFIISENIENNKNRQQTPRSLAITFPDKKILFTEHGKLSLFVDKADTVDILSSSVTKTREEISDDLKESLQALGYLE